MFSKVVKEEEFTSINGNFKTHLLLSDLNKGIYFMKIKVNENEKVIKIVLSE
ncbi:MAG: T9SS type A sorting domain-containing protein [Sphingobacteriaceae bacterium]